MVGSYGFLNSGCECGCSTGRCFANLCSLSMVPSRIFLSRKRRLRSGQEDDNKNNVTMERPERISRVVFLSIGLSAKERAESRDVRWPPPPQGGQRTSVQRAIRPTVWEDLLTAVGAHDDEMRIFCCAKHPHRVHIANWTPHSSSFYRHYVINRALSDLQVSTIWTSGCNKRERCSATSDLTIEASEIIPVTPVAWRAIFGRDFRDA